MAKQNVQQDILNFLNRNAAVAQENNFDFADWENNLKQQLDGNNRKGIVTLIANYIDMVMDYCTNKTCKEQITYSRMYFNRLLPFLQRLLENAVLIEVTKLVLDTIIVENTCFWCVKKELLKVYNNWFLKKELIIRNNVIEQLLPIYLYKLMDSICTNGDYDLQKTVIETIHGLYPSDYLHSVCESLIPGSLKLDIMFLNIYSETFNKDCRLFLNAINKKNEEKIYSVFCKYVQIGGIFSELPRVTKQSLMGSMEEGGLWVDFNLEDKAISWYYKGHSLDESSLELVTLFASDINTYSWEIDGSQLDQVKLHLKLKGSLVSSSLNDDSFVRQANRVTIIAENNEFVQNLASNILAKIFENVSSIEDHRRTSQNNYGKSTSKLASYTVPSSKSVPTNYKFLPPAKKHELPSSNNQDEVIAILSSDNEVITNFLSDNEVITNFSSDNSLTIASPQKSDPPLTNLLKEKSQEAISKSNIKILSNVKVVRSRKENVHKDLQGSTVLPEEVPNLADENKTLYRSALEEETLQDDAAATEVPSEPQDKISTANLPIEKTIKKTKKQKNPNANVIDSDSSEDNLQTNVPITVIADVHVPPEIRKDKEVAKNQSKIDTAKKVNAKKVNAKKVNAKKVNAKKVNAKKVNAKKVNAKKGKTAARKSGKKATGVTSERKVSDEYPINRKFLFKIISKEELQRKKERKEERRKFARENRYIQQSLFLLSEKLVSGYAAATETSSKSQDKVQDKGKTTTIDTEKRKYDDTFPGTSNLKCSKKLKGDAKIQNKTLENGDNLSIYNEKCIAENMSFLSKKIITWSCKSYYKGKFVEIHSKDYFDKYLVILFYPLDFGKMPHCESPKEILEINENYEKFRRLKTEVLCCSVDTVDTHKRLIESLGINDLKFPLLEDPTHEISNTFHMYCAPHKHSYRGCFIINQKGYIAHHIKVDFTSSIPLEEILEGIQMASNDC